MPEYERESETPERISWRIHERDMARLAHAYKVAIIALCIFAALAVAFAVCEAYLRHIESQKWLAYLSEYDFASYDYTQDGQGLNIIGNSNGVDYNVPKTESKNQNQEEPQYGQGPGDAEKGQEMNREAESTE